ncbi:unnamed protein product [Nippostrongylus brasiliensis]|uniref:PC4 domain-containing protein n=1 Tax=Nippostrongylus brasiliensis TaxID=27835 RepID=A0A0N4YPQ3_NIPBR|nr:hypothetical protein Q1695_007133 [Nippostrongylus brasiliensis]VDL82954.1 unnamed protein product [Nippostrongylus brasiliensis]
MSDSEEEKVEKKEKKRKKENKEQKPERREIESDSCFDEGAEDKTPVKKLKGGANRIKNSDGEEMIETGSMRYVTMRPGKKGITLSKEQYQNFEAVMGDIDAKL